MTLTLRAAEYLYDKLAMVDVPENSVIRFSMDGKTLTTTLDCQKTEDTVVLYKKVLLVVMARETASQLETTTVDLLATEKGEKLVIS